MRRVFFALALTPALTLLVAADWPRFRGPNGSGVVAEPVPLKWSATENRLWTAEVPGVGHSSPIVVKGRVLVQSASADGSKRMLDCFDAATGKPLWTKTATGHPAHIHAKNTLASSTPAGDGERVFAIFWDGNALALSAYDLDGKELWSASLGGFVSDHGAGLSPVVYDGKVFVNYDQSGAAEFVCYDAATGAKKWGAKRKAFRACSSSPLVRDLGNGKAEVIDSSTAGVTGYDPDTGSVNWDWEWKFDGMALRTVGSPVLATGGSVVVVPSGDGGGSRSMVALAPGPHPKLLWEKRKDTPYVPCPLVKGDHLYWLTDGGLAVCAEVRTGKIVWSERAFPNLSKGTYVHSSPVLVGDDVVAIAETGKVVVFKASPAGFEVVAENTIGEPVTATPAAADGKLYVRGAHHLYCIGKK